MKDFILSALPWIAIAVSIAICAVYSQKQKEKSDGDKENNYSIEGLCLGMCIAVMLSCVLKWNLGLCIAIGTLLGTSGGIGFSSKPKQTQPERTTDAADGRTLPGFLKKSFTLPFAGGEIWFEHLDGIYQYSDLVTEKLNGDIPAFQRPSAPSNIAFVLDETVITDDIISQITAALTETNKRFLRVAIIGADRNPQNKLKHSLLGHGFALRFFSDTEKAKEWLIMEN